MHARGHVGTEHGAAGWGRLLRLLCPPPAPQHLPLPASHLKSPPEKPRGCHRAVRGVLVRAAWADACPRPARTRARTHTCKPHLPAAASPAGCQQDPGCPGMVWGHPTNTPLQTHLAKRKEKEGRGLISKTTPKIRAACNVTAPSPLPRGWPVTQPLFLAVQTGVTPGDPLDAAAVTMTPSPRATGVPSKSPQGTGHPQATPSWSRIPAPATPGRDLGHAAGAAPSCSPAPSPPLHYFAWD